jgi:hypothetical protein
MTIREGHMCFTRRQFLAASLASGTLAALPGVAKPSEAIPDPVWHQVPPLRRVGKLVKSLADIECRMPTRHIYRAADKSTWAHETTHGLNSRLRNAVSGKVNAFYVLDGKAAIIKEPAIRLSFVANSTPRAFRTGRWQLYAVQQQRYWDSEPLYILDEWTAYLNGARVAYECGMANSDFAFSLEMGQLALVLGFCVDHAIRKKEIRYDQTQLKRYLAWSWRRTFRFWETIEKNGSFGINPRPVYDKLRIGSGVADWRAWCRWYFGKRWTGRNLRF